jgi:hypothetical protein
MDRITVDVSTIEAVVNAARTAPEHVYELVDVLESSNGKNVACYRFKGTGTNHKEQVDIFFDRQREYFEVYHTLIHANTTVPITFPITFKAATTVRNIEGITSILSRNWEKTLKGLRKKVAAMNWKIRNSSPGGYLMPK